MSKSSDSYERKPNGKRSRSLLNCQRNGLDLDGGGDNTGSGSYFSFLPAEMVDKILEEVISNSRQDGYRARAVCRQWNETLLKKLPFGGVLNDKTIHTVSKLDPDISLKTLSLGRLNVNLIDGTDFPEVGRGHVETGGSVVSLRKENQFGGETFHPRQFRRSVDHLIIGGDVGAFLIPLHGNDEEELPYSLSTGFAEDHKLLREVNRSIHGIDLANILPQLKDVKTLTLSSIAFFSVSYHMMKELGFREHFLTITKLDICIGSKTDIDKILFFFHNANCPNLSSLYIRVYAHCFRLMLYISFYLFIAKHPQLKNLSISQAECFYKVPPGSDDPKLTIRHYPDLVENLMKIKLECLRMDWIVCGSPVVEQWKNLEKAFLKNQSTLRSLELQVCFRGLDCRVDELLPSCQRTLERLDIASSNNVPNHFDCRGISDFIKLSQCHIVLREPSDYVLCMRQLDEFNSGLSRMKMLPPSITSLHLGKVPNLRDIHSLLTRLVNLQRISYIGPDSNTEMSPFEFLLHLSAHLHFPKLTEFRIYQYSCPEVVSVLNNLKGLICYCEDEETIVIYVDREEFDVDMLNSVQIDVRSE